MTDKDLARFHELSNELANKRPTSRSVLERICLNLAEEFGVRFCPYDETAREWAKSHPYTGIRKETLAEDPLADGVWTLVAGGASPRRYHLQVHGDSDVRLPDLGHLTGRQMYDALITALQTARAITQNAAATRQED